MSDRPVSYFRVRGTLRRFDILVLIDADNVRAVAKSDPSAVAIGIALDDHFDGESIPLSLGKRIAIEPSLADLGYGSECCLGADGVIHSGKLTPYGPGRAGIALCPAAPGEPVVVRFDEEITAEPPEEPAPPVKESLDRLGAALEALTETPGGVTVPPCRASASSTARS